MLVTIIRLDGHAIQMHLPEAEAAPPSRLDFAEVDVEDGIRTTFKRISYKRNEARRSDGERLWIYF